MPLFIGNGHNWWLYVEHGQRKTRCAEQGWHLLRRFDRCNTLVDLSFGSRKFCSYIRGKRNGLNKILISQEESSTEKITNFFGAENTDAKAAYQSSNNNNKEENDENKPSTSHTENMDYKSMLDDGDDDFAMLDLDF